MSHAHSVLYNLFPSLNLLHDSHQLPGILRHFLSEGADAVRHVQNGRPDLVGFSFQNCMLGKKGFIIITCTSALGVRIKPYTPWRLFLWQKLHREEYLVFI